MQLRKIGDGFLIGGVVLGALAAVGYVADIVPDLPPAVLKLVIYKLTFIGGLGLVVFGAFLRRMASHERVAVDAASPESSTTAVSQDTPRALGEGELLGNQWPGGARQVTPIQERRERR